ncbi:protein cordon-bleu-like isoform X2 [Argiope bruennichi]|uniref:protein cordon-bleu-like isoform X2 n=1 Tax=Argiope bruennichi TaxID=94029 RepID=UPI002494447F|nr:protein cordon-bleu-like isoform X2 [Argiope bruennichi]
MLLDFTTSNQQNSRCHPQQPQETQQKMSTAYHNAGDDCAINELLEGRMELDVILPDGRKVRLTVERRTPMMDLLVQAASATKISPAGHTIHVFGDGGKGTSTLHYKPSTPIGSLDANTICIVPKKDAHDSNGRRISKATNRPFEPTFRVQVHLPRNQLTVVRVSPRVKISELRSMVCQEKGLDLNRYQLVRPNDLGQPLTGDMTLAEYGSTEITLLSNSCIESHICNSTSHVIPYSKRTEEHKKKTGILRLLAEDASHKVSKQSLKNGNIPNHRPAPTIKITEAPAQGRGKPKKRRPAPPPPAPVLPEPPFHSRQSSSDSSGYHEATSSYLHEEHCVTINEKASSDSSGVSSLDAKELPSQVTTVTNTKKRKAPPPPPPPPVIQNGQQDQKVVADAVQSCDSGAEMDQTTGKTSPELIDEAIEIPSAVEPEIVETSEPIVETEEPVQGLVEDCAETREDKNEKQEVESDSVTRVALVALNARIEQEVTQQEIASSIQAAFHSLDNPQRIGPSLLAIKQRGGRTPNGAVTPQDRPLSTPGGRCPKDISPQPPVYSESENGAKDFSYPLQKSTARLSLDLEPPKDKKKKNVSSSPKIPALTSYELRDDARKASCDVQNASTKVALDLESRHNIKNSNSPILQKTLTSNVELKEREEDLSYSLQKPSIPLILDLKDETENCLETFPPPPSEFCGVDNEAFVVDEDIAPVCRSPTRSSSSTSLRRSSSLLNLAEGSPSCVSIKSKKARHLQRSLSDLSCDDKQEFEIEQERLQREYIKLQRQFIRWQEQLLNNHAMLREECIVPQYARTLRQSHSLPEGEDYSDEAPTSCPLVTRSLSYEPTKCSTLPRSTINIPSLDFGPVPITNGSSTLRSSKTKNYFKPPQVRISTKNRQRLPPEIRKDGDLDIYDDSKILSTILPSFESLKLISETNDDDVDGGVLKPKKNAPAPLVENLRNNIKKVPPPVPTKTTTYQKPSLKQNNEKNLNGHLGCPNGSIGQSMPRVSDPVTKAAGHSEMPAPPPPPPMPTGERAKGSNKTNGLKSISQKRIIEPQMDPREQLMQEIRKCGGRTALRKISLDIVS